MYKILKQGKLKYLIHHVNCHNCGCEFEVEDDDKELVSKDKNSWCMIIKCPFCNLPNNIFNTDTNILTKEEYEEWKKKPDKPEELKEEDSTESETDEFKNKHKCNLIFKCFDCHYKFITDKFCITTSKRPYARCPKCNKITYCVVDIDKE